MVTEIILLPGISVVVIDRILFCATGISDCCIDCGCGGVGCANGLIPSLLLHGDVCGA